MMLKPTGLYPKLMVDASGRGVVPHAGSVLLTRTAEVVGLQSALSAALEPWRKLNAVYDPGEGAVGPRGVRRDRRELPF